MTKELQGPIIVDMPIEDYHRHPAYSKTDISRAERSTSYVGLKRNEDRKASAAFDKGSVTHIGVLEPEKMGEVIFVDAGSRNSKKYKEAAAGNLGGYVMLANEKEDIDAMVDSVMSHPVAGQLFSDGKAEVSVFSRLRGEGFDLHMKCRPDYLKPGHAIDLKTTKSIEPVMFGKDAYNYKYHWSAWLSCRILQEVTGEPHHYTFVCVENKYPFETVVYSTPHELFALAEVELMPVLRRLSNDHWNGVFTDIAEDKVIDLEFPAWAMRALRQNEQF